MRLARRRARCMRRRDGRRRERIIVDGRDVSQEEVAPRHARLRLVPVREARARDGVATASDVAA
eukprot:1929471-Prymnesium_polylepis.1